MTGRVFGSRGSDFAMTATGVPVSIEVELDVLVIRSRWYRAEAPLDKVREYRGHWSVVPVHARLNRSEILAAPPTGDRTEIDLR